MPYLAIFKTGLRLYSSTGLSSSSAEEQYIYCDVSGMASSADVRFNTADKHAYHSLVPRLSLPAHLT